MRQRRRPWLRSVRLTCAIVMVLVVLWPVFVMADEYIELRSGRWLRVKSYRIDAVHKVITVELPNGSTITMPLRAIVRVVSSGDSSRIRAGGASTDAPGSTSSAPEPTAASRQWMPTSGWGAAERWDEWEGAPRWQYRWSTSPLARALVPTSEGDCRTLQFRALPIAYARQQYGARPVDEPVPVLRILIESSDTRTLQIAVDDWSTYEVPVQCCGDEGWLAVDFQIDERARPADFSGGLNEDTRELGVAISALQITGCASRQTP